MCFVDLKCQRVESKTWTYHERFGAGRRTAVARRGCARQFGTPTDRFAQETTDHADPRASRKTVPKVSPEVRTKEILVESKTRRAPRAGRVEAVHGGWARQVWVGRGAVGSILPGDNTPSCPFANREHCPERLFGSTNSIIRTENRWRRRNKTRS